MQGKKVVNGLNGGMSLDMDVQHLNNDTYRYSMNGNIIFNKDGTYSWKTPKGNAISVNIQPNNGSSISPYKLLGSTGSDDLTILFLYDEVNNDSEIGLFTISPNGQGIYKTLFNDINDPYGDNLNFKLKNQIRAEYLFENPNTIRVYWIDGVETDSNQPRVFTFKYDGVGNLNDANSYLPVTTSVHAIDTQPNFSMGLIKYVSSIGGGLLSGIYQYTYRLQTNDGYLTPWYPATKRIIVSASAKNATNDSLYEYSNSGLQTSIGNLIEIKGIDQKFDKIDVAYLYSQTENIVSEAKIFAQQDISSDVMTFENTANIGEPLIVEEIPAIYQGLRAAKTLNVKDSTLYFGNVKEGVILNFNIENILTNFDIKPKFRDMLSDEKQESVNTSPLATNTTKSNLTTRRRLHNAAGGDEFYIINNDYQNYNGTQIDHMYAGYWRGETYRFAIVVYDKLGFQTFAYHLCDIKMPDQYDNAYSWSRVKEDGSIVTGGGTLPEAAWLTNNYEEYISDSVIYGEARGSRLYSHLRIMGVEVSGIDMSSIKNDISGFKIVRTELDKTILAQGLLTPNVEDGGIIYPLPSNAQSFYLLNNFNNGQKIPNNQPMSSVRYYGMLDNDGPFPSEYRIKPQIHSFYSPELQLTLNIPTLQSNDVLDIVGGCWGSAADGSYAHNFIQADHAYTKYYYTKNTFHFNSEYPYPHYGDKINMLNITSLNIGEVVPSLPIFGNEYKNWNKVAIVSGVGNIFNFSSNFKLDNNGKQQLLIEADNIFASGNWYTPVQSRYLQNIYRVNSATDRYGGNPKYMGTFIVNYKRPNTAPYGGLTTTSLEQTIYFSTGHFQPINNPLFPTPANFVFDEIEVYGGDCYLDYFTELKLYPDSEDNKPNPGNSYDDYACGVSFPIEASINHTLRYSPSSPKALYANVGSRSSKQLHGGVSTNFPNGLYTDFDGGTAALEDFNINSVLYFEELTFFYNSKPIEFQDNTHYPVRWRYTPEKFYGDPIDTWRIFQANDYRDLNGVYGPITSSVYLMNQIYSFQESAFGRLRASDRALIESQQGGTLTTGVGDKLDGVDYISTEFGNQHQWSLFTSDTSAYWVDNNKAKIMRFGQDGKMAMSDLKGVHQFVGHESSFFYNNDNPVQNNGITGVYDYDNNAALFIFKRDRTRTSNSASEDIIINSRSTSANNVDNYIVEEGDTAIVNWQYSLSTTNGIVIPFNTDSSLGENTNKYFYLYNNGSPVNVFSEINGVKTLLFTAASQQCYSLFRMNINNNWEYVPVTINEIPDQRATVVYSEMGDNYFTFNSINPSIVLSHKNKILSADYSNPNYTPNSLYIDKMGTKGQTYDATRRSIIDIPINEEALLPKVFDSIRVNCNKYFKNKLIEVILTTDNQYARIDMTSDNRPKYLEDVLRFPLRGTNQQSRMRGKHLIVRLVIDNTNNQDDMLTNILTIFRNSNRY